jgi:glucokinase
MTWAAGIDVGGTRIKAVAASVEGTILRHVTHATADGTATAADWIRLAREALEVFSRELGRPPAAVGVCAPGLAARDGRSIAHLPGKLAGLAGLDWTKALERNEAVPVLNDAHAALLGEAWAGAARGRNDVVMLTLGTGVGGAVLAGGRLLRGAIGRAGHIGHLSLDQDGTPSITGMPGALETLVGECTLAERSGGRFTSTTDLVAAHRAGDAHATRVWLESVRALAFGVGSCINLFDPEVIAIGGGIARAGDDLFTPLNAELARIEWRPGGHKVPIVPAILGEWSGALGAAALALRPA